MRHWPCSGHFRCRIPKGVRGLKLATSLIDPQGNLLCYVPYGEEQLLVREIDPSKATRLFATWIDPSLHSG